jgi:hypothetical protein
LLIDKSITLKGEDANSTQVIFHSRQFNKTFDFHGRNITYTLWEQILNITAPNVRLSGFTIKNTDNGEISLVGDSTKIVDNLIQPSISGSGNGIQILNNSFSGGIRLTGSNLSIVQNTVGEIIDCREGSYNIIVANIVGTVVHGHDEPYYPRICLSTGSFGIVYANNITIGTVGGLELTGNGNIAAKNNVTSSIWVNGSDNTIFANTVKSGGLIVTGDDNTFYANNVGGYNETNQQFNYNLHRFTLYSFQSAPYALSLGTSYDDVLAGKTARTSVNNTFYNNNFNGNTQLRLWDGVYGPNFWNNAQQGNYWSDYNGTDANHDGIGDTLYIIDTRDREYLPVNDTGIQDSYPLVAPFNETIIEIELPEWAIAVLSSLVLPTSLPEHLSIETLQPFPTVYIATALGVSTSVIGTILLFYFKKHRQKS